MRTVSECNNYIYYFHKGSLADLIGHFIPKSRKENSNQYYGESLARNVISAPRAHLIPMSAK